MPEKALAGLRDSFRRFEYDRMAREIARLAAIGEDPLMAVAQAFTWTYDHFEYGATHAQATAADWLALRAQYGGGDAGHDGPARAPRPSQQHGPRGGNGNKQHNREHDPA